MTPAIQDPNLTEQTQREFERLMPGDNSSKNCFNYHGESTDEDDSSCDSDSSDEDDSSDYSNSSEEDDSSDDSDSSDEDYDSTDHCRIGNADAETSLQEVLASLPSKTLRITSVDGIRQHQDDMRRGPVDTCDSTTHAGHARIMLQLRTIREEPLTMEEKRSRRQQLLPQFTGRKRGWSRTGKHHHCVIRFQHSMSTFFSVFHPQIVSRVHQRVRAEAGSSVSALFSFIGEVLVVNAFIAVVFLAIVIATVVFSTSAHSSVCLSHDEAANNYYIASCNTTATVRQVQTCSKNYSSEVDEYIKSSSVLNYIQDPAKGTGYFEKCVIFLGAYDETFAVRYLIALSLAFAFSILFVVRYFNKWIRMQHQFFNFEHYYPNLIFRGWNWTINKREDANNEEKLLVKEILGTLANEELLGSKRTRTDCERRVLYAVRIVTHLIAASIILGCWHLIYQTNIKCPHKDWASPVALIVVKEVAMIIFKILSKLEKNESHNMLLIFVIRSMCVYLLSIVALVISKLVSILDDPDNCADCWETHLGQQIYSLIIIATIVELSKEFFLVIPLFQLSKTWKLFLPKYKIELQVLFVLKLQTLSWIGMLCSPLIPLVVVMSLLIILALNLVNALVLKLKPVILILASKSSSLFSIAMLLSLVLSLLPAAVVLFWAKPSLGCGPFRNYNFMYQVMTGENSHTSDCAPGYDSSIITASTTDKLHGSGLGFSYWPFVALGVTALLLVLLYYIFQVMALLHSIRRYTKLLKMACRFRKKYVKKKRKKERKAAEKKKKKKKKKKMKKKNKKRTADSAAVVLDDDVETDKRRRKRHPLVVKKVTDFAIFTNIIYENVVNRKKV